MANEKISDLNDAGAITGTEVFELVQAGDNKKVSALALKTYNQTGAELQVNKGVAGGYASLDGGGKVPASELPSYVDDVVEVANFAALPGSGETGKIYVTIDDGKTFRWSGAIYVEISNPSLATETTAGIAEVATQAETNTGTDDARMLTPKKLKDQNYLAPLASPALTGNPTTPTQAAGDNSTKIASTAFVQQEIINNIYLSAT